ncbi:MAG: hypothetical protein U0704_17140 [Candidatus Eisenbacteria bacterium]
MNKLLRVSALVIGMLVTGASLVSAASVNLAWNDCIGDGGVQNKTFACASNTGNHDLYGSFVPPAGITAMTGLEAVLDLLTADPAFTNWWRMFSAGSCRQSSLSVNFFPGPNMANCVDYWQSQASGGIGAYTVGFGGTTNRARILLVGATAPANATSVDPNLEYYGFTLRINSAKTVGTGACTGCTDKVCIVLNSINLTQPVGVGDQKITSGVNQIATWQSENSSTCLPVPARNRTWGQVKSLYR